MVDIGADTPQRRTLVTGLVEQFALLFSEVLNPVNPKAQKKVPVPSGLDLDANINEPEEDEEEEEDKDDGYSLETKEDEPEAPRKPLTKEEREEAHERMRLTKARQANDPFYLKDLKTKDITIDDIPEKHLAKDDLPDMQVEKKKKPKKTNLLADDAKVPKKVYKILKNEDLPDGAAESDDEKEKTKKPDDEDVDLETPLGADEVMPRVQAYGTPKIGGGEDQKKNPRKRKGEREKTQKRQTW